MSIQDVQLPVVYTRFFIDVKLRAENSSSLENFGSDERNCANKDDIYAFSSMIEFIAS